MAHGNTPSWPLGLCGHIRARTVQSCISYTVYVAKPDRTVKGYASATGIELFIGGTTAVLASGDRSVAETVAIALTIAVVADAVFALVLNASD